MTQLILFLGAILISWLVFTWLIKVVKTTVSTAVMLAALVMLLQIGFGIDTPMLAEAIVALPQVLGDLAASIFGSGS
ncbi:MAG: hypothetical protein ACFB9N_06275 [Geitlerinemataceae cyanobacterium]